MFAVVIAKYSGVLFFKHSVVTSLSGSLTVTIDRPCQYQFTYSNNSLIDKKAHYRDGPN